MIQRFTFSNPLLMAGLEPARAIYGPTDFKCVTWPRIGKGRHRQFFKDKTEAETVLRQKLVEQENFGTAGLSFNERQRAEYLECAEKLQPFGVTIR